LPRRSASRYDQMMLQTYRIRPAKATSSQNRPNPK
jgi:hypothetical protein